MAKSIGEKAVEKVAMTFIGEFARRASRGISDFAEGKIKNTSESQRLKRRAEEDDEDDIE